MFRLILFLRLIEAFEENKFIKETLVTNGEFFMVSIHFNGVTFDPSETAFIKLDQNLTLNITKINEYICSGVILNKLIIITSAHCVFQSKSEFYSIHIKTYDLEIVLFENVYEVEDIIIHHDYKPFRTLTNYRLRNDLALILLKR